MRGCSFEGCDRPWHCRDYCTGHYWQWWKGRELTPLRSSGVRVRDLPCTFDGCDRMQQAKGYCNGHYTMHRTGKPLVPLRRRNAKFGERLVLESGYVRICVPGYPSKIWPLEHRWVMEQIIGRYLLSNETVHHKNGNRQDNRPENLELWVSSQPRGQRVQDLLEWAREIEASYGSMMDSGVIDTPGIECSVPHLA